MAWGPISCPPCPELLLPCQPPCLTAADNGPKPVLPTLGVLGICPSNKKATEMRHALYTEEEENQPLPRLFPPMQQPRAPCCFPPGGVLPTGSVPGLPFPPPQ